MDGFYKILLKSVSALVVRPYGIVNFELFNIFMLCRTDLDLWCRTKAARFHDIDLEKFIILFYGVTLQGGFYVL